MCDFCGADIFQSFFECRKCVRSSEGDKLSIGDGLLICPSCYVTGRTCRCGHMQAAQVRPFEDLFQARQAGWDTVWPVLEKKPENLKLMWVSSQVLQNMFDLKPIFRDFDKVFKREFAPTFHAAFQLLQYRNSNDETIVSAQCAAHSYRMFLTKLFIFRSRPVSSRGKRIRFLVPQHYHARSVLR